MYGMLSDIMFQIQARAWRDTQSSGYRRLLHRQFYQGFISQCTMMLARPKLRKLVRGDSIQNSDVCKAYCKQNNSQVSIVYLDAYCHVRAFGGHDTTLLTLSLAVVSQSLQPTLTQLIPRSLRTAYFFFSLVSIVYRIGIRAFAFSPWWGFNLLFVGSETFPWRLGSHMQFRAWPWLLHC